MPVSVTPTDLLGQKTALFGMTRTGKSNTTKIILKAIFEMRWASKDPQTIGQLVFDPNGEYANENTQDASAGDNPNAIKNVWKCYRSQDKDKYKKDVVTYGITRHPFDPDRILMLLNFFQDRNLQTGKEIINSALSERNSIYIKNFCDVNFNPPEEADMGEKVRFNRRVLFYRALLHEAGFGKPSAEAYLKGLFGPDILKALRSGTGDEAPKYQSCASILEKEKASWTEVAQAGKILEEYIDDKKSNYQAFESEYVKKSSSGKIWADDALKKILGLWSYPNGPKLLGAVKEQHTDQTKTDFADDIYEHLKLGRLVIIDQSMGIATKSTKLQLIV